MEVEPLLDLLGRGDVKEVALQSGRPPCALIGDSYKALTTDPLAEDHIMVLLGQASGRTEILGLLDGPRMWQHPYPNVGIVMVSAAYHGAVLQVRFRLKPGAAKAAAGGQAAPARAAGTPAGVSPAQPRVAARPGTQPGTHPAELMGTTHGAANAVVRNPRPGTQPGTQASAVFGHPAPGGRVEPRPGAAAPQPRPATEPGVAFAGASPAVPSQQAQRAPVQAGKAGSALDFEGHQADPSARVDALDFDIPPDDDEDFQIDSRPLAELGNNAMSGGLFGAPAAKHNAARREASAPIHIGSVSGLGGPAEAPPPLFVDMPPEPVAARTAAAPVPATAATAGYAPAPAMQYAQAPAAAPIAVAPAAAVPLAAAHAAPAAIADEPLLSGAELNSVSWNDADGKRLEVILRRARELKASDVHIVSDRPVMMRLAADLVPQGEAVAASLVERMLLPRVPRRVRGDLEQHGSADYALTHPELGRFRVNVGRQRTGYKMTARLIAAQVPTLGELGLPEAITAATHHHQGLIVVTGPTGHGKTSTLAAIVNIINTTRQHHIISVEDPIEYVHPRKLSMMSQREVGSHTKTFAAALKGSLREDPDVIVVGELRDTETVRMALSAAETGHLVISTMNTPSAAKAIERIIDLFPPGDQPQVRMTLAGGLRLVVSQRLLPRADKKTLCCAAELLPGSPGLWALIRDNKTFQIPSLQQRGKALGIVRLDDSLAQLVRDGVTTMEIARLYAESPETFEATVSGKGVRADEAPLTLDSFDPTAAAAQRGLQMGKDMFSKAGKLFGGEKK